MIFWQKIAFGYEGFGSYRGWSMSIKSKFLSNTKFKVTYTLDERSVLSALSYDILNRAAIENYWKRLMKGKVYTEYTEIETFLKWPKSQNENAVTNEATTYAVAYLNRNLGDAVTYLKKKGLLLKE